MLIAANNPRISVRKIITEKDLLQVEWADGYRSQFHYLWLRDNCPSVPRINGQRNVDPLIFAAEPYPKKVCINQEKKIAIVWANDGHVSKFEPVWLRKHDYSNGTQAKWQPKLWGSEKVSSLAKADYSDILQDEAKLRNWLLSLRDDGIAVLENVPIEPDTVLEVAAHLGSLRETYWGKITNVKSVNNPVSPSFTNLTILPHTDLTYFDDPAAYLLLHYLQISNTGGEVTIVDGFKIAEVLRQEAPEKFKLLSSLPVKFRVQFTDADLSAEGEIIRLDCLGKVKSIRFSCRSIQPFNFPSEAIKPYYEAYCTFAQMCNSDEYIMRVKVNSGDLLILDNHRVLHGRTEYSGERWVQIACIERTELLSRLSVLSR
ncbi:MAG: DUF971 domain-containing protein [Oscillatoria sp. SIO1A7]|nr:DUF971 domain-containing protein [Oscillatoria sp. SIO1A7]